MDWKVNKEVKPTENGSYLVMYQSKRWMQAFFKNGKWLSDYDEKFGPCTIVDPVWWADVNTDVQMVLNKYGIQGVWRMVKIETARGDMFIKTGKISFLGGINKYGKESTLSIVVDSSGEVFMFKTKTEAEDAKEKLRVAMALATNKPDHIHFEGRMATSEDMALAANTPTGRRFPI